MEEPVLVFVTRTVAAELRPQRGDGASRTTVTELSSFVGRRAPPQGALPKAGA